MQHTFQIHTTESVGVQASSKNELNPSKKLPYFKVLRKYLIDLIVFVKLTFQFLILLSNMTIN